MIHPRRRSANMRWIAGLAMAGSLVACASPRPSSPESNAPVEGSPTKAPVTSTVSQVESVPAAPAASTSVSRAQMCSAISAGLTKLKPGEPLAAQGAKGKTWKTLYDDCDRSNRFAGLALPKHNGKRLRCSSDPNRVASIDRYADGTVVFNSKAGVDADGSPVVGGSGWPNDVQTWLTFDKGSKDHFVNAEAVPFIVMPLPVPKIPALSLMKDTGVGKGDLAVVVKGEQCSLAVVGDAGPWFRLGEASMRTHEDLGNPQCAVQGQLPCRALKKGSGVGIPSGVTFIVFPGSRPKPLESQTVNAVVEKAAGERVLQFLATHAK